MGGSITTVLKFWYYNTVPLMLVSSYDLSGCTEAKSFYLGSSCRYYPIVFALDETTACSSSITMPPKPQPVSFPLSHTLFVSFFNHWTFTWKKNSSFPHNSYMIMQVRRGAAPWLFRTSWKEIIMKQADTGRPVSDWNSLPRDPHRWRFYMQIGC